MKNSTLKIGTCSWKYDSWKGLVYPEAKIDNYLEAYSQKFNSVEIDQWFWSLFDFNKIVLPKKEVVEEYNNSVPNDFKFIIKVPNSITLTHFYKKDKSNNLIINPYFLNTELFDEFLHSIEALNNKIGLLIFQFEYLNKQKMPSQFLFFQKFEEFVKKIPQNINYGIEIRNPNYLNRSYYKFLNKNNLSMVFLQGYYMPPIWETFNQFIPFIKNDVVIRLLGEDRKGIEVLSKDNWSTIISNKDNEIIKIVDVIKYLISKEINIFLNVNNHYEGSAPLTIQKITNMLIGSTY